MKRKLIFLLIATLGVTCFILVGFSLGARNPIMGVLAFIASIFITGFGFTLKKKWREEDQTHS
ncbi:DUF5325 family protein [Caldalkalibacillus mannanilyticus]|uniref:DUF5325 family protein n=1 Tax=Caldalkalibacillus mannanilyticus TaxID=1418 RepID=UPI000469DDDC|nr:DUF5325 family protein [Caldalkalibacillus mannanilyticus]